MLIGIDEAGMGTLAGPATAAVVVLADDAQIKGVRDSKKMTSEQREEVAAKIMEVALFYQISHRNSDEIDRLGLSKCWLSMTEALAAAAHARYPSEKMIIDGNRCLGLRYVTPVVKADATHLAVSAASILAKYYQVCAMEDLHRLYPQYNFLTHHAYGTSQHLALLKKFGPCPAHRRSFRPVKKVIDERLPKQGVG